MYAIRSYYDIEGIGEKTLENLKKYVYVQMVASATTSEAEKSTRNNFVQHTLYEVIRFETVKKLEMLTKNYNEKMK